MSENNKIEEDRFVNKHLNVIMDKTLDSMIVTHIEKMWGGLQMASVQHFVDTGKVSGSLHLAIKELAKSFAANWHNTVSQPPTSQPEGVSAEGMPPVNVNHLRNRWQGLLRGTQGFKPNDEDKFQWLVREMEQYASSLLTQRDETIRELREEIKVITTLYENQKAEYENRLRP